MDRDVYLILVGAGISLVSSFVTILFQFIFGLIGDRIRNKNRLRMELHERLLDKTRPPQIERYNNTIKKLISSIDNREGIDRFINDISRFAYRASYMLPLVNFLAVFITVLLVWIFVVLPKIR